MRTHSTLQKHGYVWVTGFFFAVTLLGHWLFGWYAFVEELNEHSAPIEVSSYVIQMTRDTLENWQSEFLQLMWQVAGLAFLLYIGSPQSKEGDERKEEKIDLILQAVRKDADEKIKKLDTEYPRR